MVLEFVSHAVNQVLGDNEDHENPCNIVDDSSGTEVDVNAGTRDSASGSGIPDRIAKDPMRDIM